MRHECRSNFALKMGFTALLVMERVENSESRRNNAQGRAANNIYFRIFLSRGEGISGTNQQMIRVDNIIMNQHVQPRHLYIFAVVNDPLHVPTTLIEMF